MKLYAFIKRDFLSSVSYRLAFLMQVAGMVLSLAGFYFMTKMWNQNAEGLGGIPPFDWLLIGLSFQFYFSTALFAFSAKIRDEQVLGTLEAMLVSPTPTSIVIFSSAAWDFTYGAIRVLIYLAAGTLVFGVQLHVGSVVAFVLGFGLTLLSSAGIGILSASFILYFKRGNPINFLLSGTTMLFGTVFFPAEQLPEILQPVSNYMPITWSLRIVRGVLLEARTLDQLSGELVQLAILTVVLVPLGLLASRYAIRRAKREGSLIQY